MSNDSAREKVTEILSGTGVEINGTNPWDIQVNNNNFFRRVLSQGTLGLGEAYMDGWWDCGRIDEFVYRILNVDRDKLSTFPLFVEFIKSKFLNLQKRSRAFQIGERHYDTGNSLFQAMLDARMNYSCGYWRRAENLDEAQEAKLDLVCRKINLKKGICLLDIGCGWGAFVKYAAEKYGVTAVGITVSREQLQLGQKLCDALPVEIRYQDYRELGEKYDHIVSIGMIEHVGYKNYRNFMKTVHRCLDDNGLFLLQTIGSLTSCKSGDPWVSKYIFPNSMLPSAAQISKAAEGLFVMEDWHNFGADYDKTLMAWHDNFEKNWHIIKLNYDDQFYRMWKYYLLSCAGAFRSRKIQLWQVVFSKKGFPGGYIPKR